MYHAPTVLDHAHRWPHIDRVVAHVDGKRDHGHLVADDARHPIAALWYQILSETTIHGRTATTPAPTCAADATALRGWLESPCLLPGFPDMTVAESWGWHHPVDLCDAEAPVTLQNLITQAQRAGVFGLPGHTVRLWPLADSLPATVVVAVTLPGGTTLASPTMPFTRLAEAGLPGPQAAAVALTRTAHIVNQLVASAAPRLAPPSERMPAGLALAGRH